MEHLFGIGRINESVNDGAGKSWPEIMELSDSSNYPWNRDKNSRDVEGQDLEPCLESWSLYQTIRDNHIREGPETLMKADEYKTQENLYSLIDRTTRFQKQGICIQHCETIPQSNNE